MIRRSFLQTVLAVLAAPLTVLSKSTEPKKVVSFGGQMTSNGGGEYRVPVIFHMVDGTTVKATGYGDKFSYHQPTEKLHFVGDPKTYFRALGTEVGFDYLSIESVDLQAVMNWMRDKQVARVEIPYIDFPTNRVACDNEHASSKMMMKALPTPNPVQTRMDLSMTIKRPTFLAGSSIYKEAYFVVIRDAQIGNHKS